MKEMAAYEFKLNKMPCGKFANIRIIHISKVVMAKLNEYMR